MEKVIKNMMIKPIVDRVEFEKLGPPVPNSNVNIRVGDTIELEKIREDVVRVIVSRSLVADPECIFKIYVEMSAEVLVDAKEYDALADKEDYFKKTPIVRALISHIVTMIANLTTNSAVGPMITMNFLQA